MSDTRGCFRLDRARLRRWLTGSGHDHGIPRLGARQPEAVAGFFHHACVASAVYGPPHVAVSVYPSGSDGLIVAVRDAGGEEPARTCKYQLASHPVISAGQLVDLAMQRRRSTLSFADSCFVIDVLLSRATDLLASFDALCDAESVASALTPRASVPHGWEIALPMPGGRTLTTDVTDCLDPAVRGSYLRVCERDGTEIERWGPRDWRTDTAAVAAVLACALGLPWADPDGRR